LLSYCIYLNIRFKLFSFLPLNSLMMKKILHRIFKAIAPALFVCGMLSTQSFAQAPYCSITYPSGYFSWGMTQVTIGTFLQSPTFTSSYGNFVNANVPITAGVATNVSVTITGWASVGIAADFNNDNDFEDAGEVLYAPPYFAASPTTYTGTITVPPSVTSGNYRMRIWTREANGGGANGGLIPCGTYNYGRYADYTLQVTNTATCIPPSNVAVVPATNTAAISWAASTSSPPTYRWVVVANGGVPGTAPAVATGTTATLSANATGLAPATQYDAYVKSLCSASDSSVWTLAANFFTLCDGTPAVGVASSSSPSVCPTVDFTLSLAGVAAAPGITYKWQSSSASTGPFVDIPGGTTATFVTSQTAVTYYRCVVTCTGSSLSSTSNVISVGLNAATSCYCTPTATTPTSYYITSFSTTGGMTNITNNSTGSGAYNQYLSMGASQIMGSSVNVSLTTNSAFCTRAIYIDWNQDGAFDETTEKVFTSIYGTGNTAATVTGSFTVPVNALTGATRMRVRTSYYSGVTMHACNNLSYGEAEDYTFTVISPTGVCINPTNLAVSAITPTSAVATFVTPTVGNTPTNYIYQLRTDGTTPTSGALGLALSGTVTASPINFTTLSPATDYTLFVRTFCSVGDSSIWNSVSFSTNFDTLTPVSLGQFNFDVVANGIGAANLSTNNDVDNGGFALVAADFQASSTGPSPTYFVPMNRVIQNGVRKYRLADYTGNNSLRQTLTSGNGAVRFLAPKRANKVYIMGVSGAAVSNFTAVVHFSDGTTQSAPMNFPDWYTSTNQVVVSGIGRVNRNTNGLEGTATGGPRFHDSSIVISTENRNKQIDSIVIQRTGTTTGISNVMAVSIVPNVNQSCKLPGMLSIANANCMGGLLSWQGNGTNTSYEISYGPIGSLANNGTIIPITGVTGANSHQWVNALPGTSFQLYVRASCGSGSYSDWVGPLEVTLPSTIVTPAFTLPSDICSGATAPLLPNISNNSVEGTWSPAVVSNTTTGTYTFTPNATFPCAVPITVSINVSGQITPTFTQIAPFCSGSPAPTLPTTSNNGFAGTWSPALINNMASGTYTFTPNSGGSACVGNATMDVVIKPLSQEMELISICSEELPYTWNNITINAGGTSAATYVTTAANGCDSIVTLNLSVLTNTNPSVNISANPSGVVSVGTSVTFTANVIDGIGSTPTFQWHRSGADIAGATNSTWTGIAGVDFLNGDNISVTASGFNQCAAVSATTSNIIEIGVTVSISNGKVPIGFKAFPNPVNNQLTIDGLNATMQISVIDALGRVIINEEINTATTQLDFSTIGSGIYILLMQDSKGNQWSQKVIKK
jgi:hypothetical protein